MEIWLIDGPNLNLVGIREPGTYGSRSLDAVWASWTEAWELRGIHVHRFQSNVEGELIDRLQQVGFAADGIVLNPGGYTHTSVALRDAVAAIAAPVVEVHLTHIAAREDFRRISLLAPVCTAGISGLGLEGYRWAVEGLAGLIEAGR